MFPVFHGNEKPILYAVNELSEWELNFANAFQSLDFFLRRIYQIDQKK